MGNDLIFEILGIEKTKDERMIKNAYRMKLAETNPEDKPEEFMQLRNAYEEAINYARTPEETIVEEVPGNENSPAMKGLDMESPLGVWMAKVDAVYRSLKRRLDIGEWKALLEDDVCRDLEYSNEAQVRMLQYFAEHFQLSSETYRLVNQHFSVEENREECKEYLPEGFVTYFIDKVHDENGDMDFAWEWLEGDECADYDTFIQLVRVLEQQVFEEDITAATETMIQMDKLGIYHPFLEIEKIRMDVLRGSTQSVEQRVESLMERYPESLRVPILGAEAIWKAGNHRRAAEIFQQVLERTEDFLSRKYMAYYENEQENYEEAGKHAEQALHIQYDEALAEILKDVNGKLLERYGDSLPQNAEEAEDYIKACLDTRQGKKGIEFLKNSPYLEEMESGYGYLAELYLQESLWVEAVGAAETWRKKLESGEETEKTYRRKATAYSCIARAAYSMGQEEQDEWEKAKSSFDLAASALRQAIALENGEFWLNYRVLLVDALMELRQYEDAKVEVDAILAVYPQLYLILEKKQKICFELRQAQEVIDIFYQTKEIYQRIQEKEAVEKETIQLYERAAEVFWIYSQNEDVRNILKQAEEISVTSPKLKLLHVRLERVESKSDVALFELCKEAAAMLEEFIEQKVDAELQAELCYELSFIENSQYYKPFVHPGKDMEYICKAIELAGKPEYYHMYGYILMSREEYEKAYEQFLITERMTTGGGEGLYMNMGKCQRVLGNYEKAVEYYNKVLELNPERLNAYEELHTTYRQLMRKTGKRCHAEKALEYATKVIKMSGEDAYEYTDRCAIYLDLKCYEKALADAQKAAKYKQRDCWIFDFQAKAYQGLKQYQKALFYAKHAIEAMKKPGEVIEFYRTAGNICERMGDYKQAEEWYRKGMEYCQDREKGSFYNRLISMYKEMRDYNGAEKLLNESHEKGFHGFDWKYMKDKLHLNCVRHENKEKFQRQYVAEIEKMAAKEPEDVDIMEALADAYLFYKNDKQRAKEMYRKTYLQAVADNSLEWHKMVILHLMELYREEKDWLQVHKYGEIFRKLLCDIYAEEDEEAAEKAFAEDVYDGMMNLYDIGAYWLHMGNRTKAREYCQRMAESDMCGFCLKKGCTDYYELLGMIYEEEGNLEEAFRCYQTANELDKFNQYAAWKVRVLKEVKRG